LSVGFIAFLGLLALASIPNRGISAYAQQVQLQTTTTDPWYQSLEIARSKVEAALSPGAFGHGVPGLLNLSTNEILMAIWISIMVSILAFMTVRARLYRPTHKGKNVASCHMRNENESSSLARKALANRINYSLFYFTHYLNTNKTLINSQFFVFWLMNYYEH
jgi:hypothetical protein